MITNSDINQKLAALDAVVLVVMAIAFMLVTSPAWAQSTQAPVDADMVNLSNKLKVGESIVVTTDTGAEIQGRFLNISATGITF